MAKTVALYANLYHSLKMTVNYIVCCFLAHSRITFALNHIKTIDMRQLKITQEDENINKDVDKKAPKTMLEHIECIVELVENSSLNKDFFQKAKKSINYVAKKMKLTTNQVVLLAVFIEKSDNNSIEISDLSEFIKCRNIKIITLMKDIDELENRRLVRCRRNYDKPSYRVPFDVIKAVKENEIYEPKCTKNLSTIELFSHIETLIEEKREKEITYEALIDELELLLENNSSLAFCQQVKIYMASFFSSRRSFLLLLLFCHYFINESDDCLGFHNLEDFFEKVEFRHIQEFLKLGEHKLLRTKLIENVNDNGMGNREYFKLTDEAKEKLFVELDIKTTQSNNKKDLMQHAEITSKELFYNKREQSQIMQLTSLIHKDNFQAVQEKLEKGGMRKGFACLFYGAPGTGKTETAYQIARSTGRDLMMVDISETKSMWYGESEKRIKGIFEKYKSFLKTCEVAPILLFNEADAVIGKRKEAGRGTIDQTENAIQNILLQEMENLEGIMIATTNLTQNLDKAFERRFLYKIEFDKPCVEAKEKIWHTMLPALSEQERLELAHNYNFSGGQIENIVRKYTVDSILNGIAPTLDTIHGYCQSESLYKNEERKKIGFL
ncbi:AAA family ATPase [Bacteroides sp. 214]|uniref:ATP-binding protein n=1 Tax=Bacteroides sp. 214 TaxID=2302935 RepID=UPI0013D369A9|nr:ATP-binding protein [Bacteroides sp. 214]NDW11929.1 AAA family ATPase [Bacteroides sp. 214]